MTFHEDEVDGSISDAYWDEIDAIYSAYEDYRRSTPNPVSAYEWAASQK